MLFEFTQQKFRRGTIENVVENKYIGRTMNGRATANNTPNAPAADRFRGSLRGCRGFRATRIRQTPNCTHIGILFIRAAKMRERLNSSLFSIVDLVLFFRVNGFAMLLSLLFYFIFSFIKYINRKSIVFTKNAYQWH